MSTDRIHLVSLIGNAFQLAWQKKKQFLNVLLIPLVVLTLLSTYLYYREDELSLLHYLPIGIIQLLFFSIFAITCHRLVIIGDESVPRFGISKWTPRETRFVGWSIGLGLLLILIGSISGAIVFMVVEVLFDDYMNELDNHFLTIAVMLPAAYLIAKFSLVYPATAIDERPDMQWSWDITRNNGWRVTIVVWLLPLVFGYLQGLILREDATLLEVTIISLLGMTLLVVEIVALSLVYQELSS